MATVGALGRDSRVQGVAAVMKRCGPELNECVPDFQVGASRDGVASIRRAIRDDSIKKSKAYRIPGGRRIVGP